MKFQSMAAVLAVLVGFSCAAPKPAENITVVLDWTVNTNHSGLYAAQELGYFKDENITVSIEPAPESGAAPLIVAEKAQFGFSYQEEILQSHANGAPLVAVAAVLQNNTSGFAAPASKGIKRPKDFEGKTYGGWGGALEEAVIKTLMKADGGDFSKVKIQNIGSLDYFAATDKLVDFAWIFQGWTGVEAEVRNVKLDYIDLKSFSPALNYYTPVIAASGAWLSKHPDLAKRFVKALSKGYDYAVANPEKTAEILSKAAPDLNKDLVLKSQKFLSAEYKKGASKWGEFDAARWKAFLDWLTENNLIKPIDPKDVLFTNEYLP